MNGDEIKKSIEELRQIENVLDSLKPYSDDWFVWNELRLDEERKIRCFLMNEERLRKAKQIGLTKQNTK